MPRKVSLPGASELFRSTEAPAADDGATGRVRHDEKITVYVSARELTELETARLRLRAEFGIAADRGRLVREAIDAMLADLADNGETSAVVRHLRGE